MRAARGMWAKIMRNRFGAESAVAVAAFPRKRQGCSLTAQQPYNNVVRDNRGSGRYFGQHTVLAYKFVG